MSWQSNSRPIGGLTMDPHIDNPADLLQVEVEKDALQNLAADINNIEVGKNMKKNFTRPDTINILLTGGTGTGKSTFINFAMSFLNLAAKLKEGTGGYTVRATTGEAKEGQITKLSEWYAINDKICISDTRGFVDLTENVTDSIKALATSHDTNAIDMSTMEAVPIKTKGNFWKGALNSHHAVLFFLSAEDCLPFDRSMHKVVASTLYQLEKSGFQPLVVISKTDLSTPEVVAKYRGEVLHFMQSWRGEGGVISSPKLVNFEDKHLFEIANVCDKTQWYLGTRTSARNKLAFFQQGTAVLNVLEQTCFHANIFIAGHPQVGATLLAWAMYLGNLVPSRVDKSRKKQAQVASASSSTRSSYSKSGETSVVMLEEA